MTALLEDRVGLWLQDHPGRTVEDVARGVHAQTQAVRQTLSGPLFSYSLCNGRKLYRLAGDGQGRAGSGGPETDADFLLRVLRDGKPHNLNEILRRSFAERGCGLTTHSRAAELRKRGYDIRNWKDGERGAGSWYRLVGRLDEAAIPRGDAVSSSGPGSDGLLSPTAQVQNDGAAPSQLSLIEVAPRGAYTEEAA